MTAHTQFRRPAAPSSLKPWGVTNLRKSCSIPRALPFRNSQPFSSIRIRMPKQPHFLNPFQSKSCASPFSQPLCSQKLVQYMGGGGRYLFSSRRMAVSGLIASRPPQTSSTAQTIWGIVLSRCGGISLSKFRLLLLIHAHQPIGNFESVFETCYQKSYLPFVQTLARHPGIRLGLHISGPLLEWMDAHHPDYFALLRQLVDQGQLEMVGSGFYEPILISIPPEDRLEQIRRMSDFLEKQFGRRPQGAWLTERVWEPQLPSTLSAAGVEYTLVDDVHFLGAGFELADLFGYYLVEDLTMW